MGYAVSRYGFASSTKRGHRLTFIDPESRSACEELDLPFDDSVSVALGVSCGLLYVMATNGEIVICNLGSKQMKVLPKLEFESFPHEGRLRACSLGYNAASNEFMVIALCVQWYRISDWEGSEEYRFDGSKSYFQLYSFECDSWEDIPTSPTLFINDYTGVYLEKTGCCYWNAMDSRPKVRPVVLSFHFAKKSFSQFDLPSLQNREYEGTARSILADCRGSLAAIFFYESRHRSPALSFEIYVRRRGSWKLSRAFTLADVNGPIDLVRGRVLAVEAKHTSRSGQLAFYDWKSEILQRLDIYDNRSQMTVHSYDPNCEIALPGSKSIALIPYDKSTDQPLVVSEEEEKDRLEEEMRLASWKRKEEEEKKAAEERKLAMRGSEEEEKAKEEWMRRLLREELSSWRKTEKKALRKWMKTARKRNKTEKTARKRKKTGESSLQPARKRKKTGVSSSQTAGKRKKIR